MQSFFELMNLENMGKKSKKAKATPVAKEPKPSKKGLILDTTCLGLGNAS